MLSKLHSPRGLALAAATSLLFATGAASAGSVRYEGSLSDCSNVFLYGSGPDLARPYCGAAAADEAATLNNVAIYSFSITTAGNVQFQSEQNHSGT